MLDADENDAPIGTSTSEQGLDRFDGLCLVAADDVVVHASAALRARVGDQPHGTSPAPIASWLHPDDRAQVHDALSRIRGDSGPITCDVRLSTGDGRWRPCAVLLERATGGPDGLTSVVVRDRDAAVQWPPGAGHLLRRITAAANDTSETTALFARAVADVETTLGWRSGRVLPAVSSGEVGWESPATNRARRSSMPASSPLGADAPAALGGTTATAVAVPVVVAGDVTAVLEFVTDEPVTDDDLVAELGEVGHQLGSVAERERIRAQLDERSADLERSNGELERFAYVASHDLQEPLRKIVGFSELLAQRNSSDLDDTGREYLGYVVDATQRMQQLIKDLLAYSRAGRTVPEIVDVDLATLTAQVLDTMEWTIEEGGARVTVGDLPAVRGDPNQVAEVLTNLLSNAVKYAAEGGATITVDAAPAGGGAAWEITVADDGIGIEARFADQVFEVFRRLHGRGEYPGTGIGLAITQRFVEANGGRVWFTPNDPRGSVFHFTLDATTETP